MSEKLIHLNRCLENTERMLQALQKNDLEVVNQCLDRNAVIIKAYNEAPFSGGKTMEKKILQDKMGAVVAANRQCVLFTEGRCRSLRNEIESIDKNRDGFKKYGVQQARPPRFIDNRT